MLPGSQNPSRWKLSSQKFKIWISNCTIAVLGINKTLLDIRLSIWRIKGNQPEKLFDCINQYKALVLGKENFEVHFEVNHFVCCIGWFHYWNVWFWDENLEVLWFVHVGISCVILVCVVVYYGLWLCAGCRVCGLTRASNWCASLWRTSYTGRQKLFGNFPKRISVLKPEQVDGSFKKKDLDTFLFKKQKWA